MMSSMPPRHGLEGHRIRNSRDLTRKATRPVSTVSAASTSSVSSGGEGKSEELHVMAGKCAICECEGWKHFLVSAFRI
jgi:hypothetical protein